MENNELEQEINLITLLYAFYQLKIYIWNFIWSQKKKIVRFSELQS